MIDPRRENPASPLRLVLATVLSFSILDFAAQTIHWPMLGDASLMHYVVFLLDRGAVPYRNSPNGHSSTHSWKLNILCPFREAPARQPIGEAARRVKRAIGFT
jgi:hypothetical protein